MVDDCAAIRAELVDLLSRAGYHVIEAVDGIDALVQIKRTPGLALVMCDLNMPRMGGMAVLDALSSATWRVQVPFIVVTTDGDPKLVARAKLAGAKGWIMKPVRPDQLLAATQRVIG